MPGLFNELLRAPYEFVLTQSYVCMDKTSARTALKRQRDRLESTEDDALEQIEELNIALNDLQSNKFTMGEHHLALLIKANDVRELANNVAEARAALGDSGCVVAREDLALEAAFWSQLPGNFKWRPRPAPINSYNFVGMSAFHNYPTGRRTGNPLGRRSRLAQDEFRCAVLLQLSQARPRHHVADRPVGTGKTATQNFLAAQAEKFGATGIYFDKDRGSEIFVLANGGNYFSLKTNTPTGFAPFDLEATPSWIDTVRRIVMTCVRRFNDKGSASPFTAREERESARRSRACSRCRPMHAASGSSCRSSNRPTRTTSRHDCSSGVTPTTARGRSRGCSTTLAICLDVNASRLFGFDYTEFLDNAEVRTPIMMYLWSRFSSLIDGRRLYMFVDEFWKALGDDYFKEELQNRYKTMRKQNWFLICATQSPADALHSDIAHTVIEQTATFIYLPNPQAKEKDYTEGFNVTRQEYLTIKGLSETSRRFLVKQGQNAVVCELDLAGFDDELAVPLGHHRQHVPG